MDNQPSALKQLDVFVGEWEVQVSVDGSSMGRDKTLFEWVQDGAFLVQRTHITSTEGMPDEWLQNTPKRVVTLIGFDDAREEFVQLHVDDRGVHRIYQMSFENGVWKLWRDAPGFNQRFVGEFSEDGDSISGYWDTSTDGQRWERDFDLTYTRKQPGEL